MHISRLTIILILIFTISISSAQVKLANQKVVIEKHPSGQGFLLVKFYNKETNNIEHQWTMWSKRTDIEPGNYNNLFRSKKIIPHGKHYSFYPTGNIEYEDYYDRGVRIGTITGYYETGETKYSGSSNLMLQGAFIHYYKNGSIKCSEKFDRGVLNGTVTEFYDDGSLRSEAEFKEGKKLGKYISYYPDGQIKQKIAYKENEIKSQKCFDETGDKINCWQRHTKPAITGGVETIKRAINEIDFSGNINSTDTAIFRIILRIDTLGVASLESYHFKQFKYNDILINWVHKLPEFTPYFFNKEPKTCYLNIAFPLFKKQPILDLEIDSWENESRDNSNGGEKMTYIWDFSKNIPNDNVYFVVDEQPKFPGGAKAFKQFISQNMVYPRELKKNKIKGKVYVSFNVLPNGELKSFKLMKGVHPTLNEEAFRLAKLMPNWIPGKIRGKNVTVNHLVVFPFGINSSNKNTGDSKTTIRY